MKDIYIKFGAPAIKGESADKDHKDWIEVDSWDHSITQPRSATASTSGGHTSERAEHGEMIFTKSLDVVSPLLYQHCSGGSTFDEVTVDFMRADGEGKRVKYMEIKLKYVIIASVNPKIVSEGGSKSVSDKGIKVSEGGLATESFSLKYAAVQWKYTQQNIGGNQGGNSQGAWSLTKNDKTYAA